VLAYIKKVNRIHILVSQKQVFLSSIEQMIKSFEKEEFTSSMLTSIRGRIFSGEGSVAGKIKELNNLISMFDARLNMLVGFALNGLLMWDFHCISRLEKWRSSAASDLPAWLNLLGEVDGLNSLANYTYNNPYHSFPQAVNEGTVLEASGMGHPLLAEELRVNNDFSVKKKGQVIIITGANMAGKSTFLRTVAVNMLLAMAGAPVCAAAMKLFPMKLFTSMRTTDSLSHNESYFYAELKRLRTLKERLEKSENVFFILDEILKGTNSTDKSLGSKLFLRRLIELGATGLIATHDISLGEMETEFPGNVVNKCFEIEIDGENISFDYILRDGITRKMNAGVMMKQMGIV
jgi:DNA mismatch repair ATPase MutS